MFRRASAPPISTNKPIFPPPVAELHPQMMVPPVPLFTFCQRETWAWCPVAPSCAPKPLTPAINAATTENFGDILSSITTFFLVTRCNRYLILPRLATISPCRSSALHWRFYPLINDDDFRHMLLPSGWENAFHSWSMIGFTSPHFDEIDGPCHLYQRSRCWDQEIPYRAESIRMRSTRWDDTGVPMVVEGGFKEVVT